MAMRESDSQSRRNWKRILTIFNEGSFVWWVWLVLSLTMNLYTKDWSMLTCRITKCLGIRNSSVGWKNWKLNGISVWIRCVDVFAQVLKWIDPGPICISTHLMSKTNLKMVNCVICGFYPLFDPSPFAFRILTLKPSTTHTTFVVLIRFHHKTSFRIVNLIYETSFGFRKFMQIISAT